MIIKEIYERFGVPPNLAQHMLTVTKVCLFLKDHWIGPELDWDKVTKTAMLHDLGNVVKFDFDKYPEFLGPEISRVDYWKEVQKQTINKYGSDDHEATKIMLEEIEIEPEAINTILNKSFGRSVETAGSDNWYPKILLYADLRVLPNGIATLEERFADVRERMPKYVERPDFVDLLNAGRKIEKQIQENMSIPVFEINREMVGESDEELLNFKV